MWYRSHRPLLMGVAVRRTRSLLSPPISLSSERYHVVSGLRKACALVDDNKTVRVRIVVKVSTRVRCVWGQLLV